jgi:hypothetical protein
MLQSKKVKDKYSKPSLSQDEFPSRSILVKATVGSKDLTH